MRGGLWPIATRAACLASLSKRHVHRFSNSATSKMMKADCILPGSLLEVASNDAWYPNVYATCAARSLLPFPVHPASPIFVHADRVTPSLRAMYVEGGCPNGVRILPLTHFCSPPPIGASTQTVTRMLFPPLPLMVGPFSPGTLAPPCSCLVDTHHISTVLHILAAAASSRSDG